MPNLVNMIAGGVVKSQVFTTSGSWIVPQSIVGDYVRVRVSGGGGGGRSSVQELSEGGEAGHFLERSLQFTNNITVAIGAGGATSAAGGNTILSGGAALTVNGGRAGRSVGSGGQGGDQAATFNTGFGDYGKGGRGNFSSSGAESGNDGAVEIIWVERG
jgi:hypothetical protein